MGPAKPRAAPGAPARPARLQTAPGDRWALQVPGWLVALATPFGALAATAAGAAERGLLSGRLAAANQSAVAGSAAGGGPLLLALLGPALDVTAVAFTLWAFQSSLTRWRHRDGAFPAVELAALLCLNVLCFACVWPLGVVTAWGSALTMFLWTLFAVGD